jgi:hypothetical protein
MTTSRTLTYEFRVEGHLDDHWSAWLGELTITRHHDGTSTLTGPVADQAQLHGVLARLRDIGATLLSLNALEASPLPGQPGGVRLAWFFRTALSTARTYSASSLSSAILAFRISRTP